MDLAVVLAVLFLGSMAIQDFYEREIYVVYPVIGYLLVLGAQFVHGELISALVLSVFLSIPAAFFLRDGSISLGDFIGFPLIWASVAGDFTAWLIALIYLAAPISFLVNEKYEMADSVPAYVPITFVYLVYAALTVL